jgi:hypothetical protein
VNPDDLSALWFTFPDCDVLWVTNHVQASKQQPQNLICKYQKQLGSIQNNGVRGAEFLRAAMLSHHTFGIPD